MDFEMQKQDELGSVLPYLLSPVSLCTSLVILICIYVIVPFIGPRFIPSYNGLKENRRRFDSFLGTSLHHAVVPALAVYALASGAITNQVHVQNQSVLGLYILQMTQGFLVAEFIVILHDPIQRRRRRINLFHHVLFITVGCYMAFLLRGTDYSSLPPLKYLRSPPYLSTYQQYCLAWSEEGTPLPTEYVVLYRF